MADPTTIQCTSSCTVTVVHELVFPPFQLSAEDGMQIALATGAVWAVGFVIRAIRQAMSTGDGNPTEGN